jgi:hypothetical protein
MKHEKQIRSGKEIVSKINVWQVSTFVLIVLFLASVITGGFNFEAKKVLPEKTVADKAVKYINENMLNGQGLAKVDSVDKSGDLYLLNLDVNGQKFASYVTKDGEMFFTQAINLSEKPNAVSPTQEQQAPQDVPKTDKPNVELFVMSHCPYGTQAEKGIIPAIKTLGNKVNFEVKFVNYAMHPSKGEVEEQLNQYCIQKEFKDKYLTYLSKFLEAGNSKDAFTAAGITEADIKSCVDKTDTEFSVTKNLEDKASWSGGRFPKFMIHDAESRKYGVQGSPTLIINGEQSQSGRDAKSLLNAICNAFTNKPSECNTDMSSYGNPAPGFGFGTQGGSATAAGCGV